MAGLFETADALRQKRLNELQRKQRFGQVKAETLGGAVGGAFGRFVTSNLEGKAAEKEAQAQRDAEVSLFAGRDPSDPEVLDTIAGELDDAGEFDKANNFRKAATTRRDQIKTAAPAAAPAGKPALSKVTVNDNDLQITGDAMLSRGDNPDSDFGELYNLLASDPDPIRQAKARFMRNAVATTVNTIRRDLDAAGKGTDQGGITEFFIDQLEESGVLMDDSITGGFGFFDKEPVFERDAFRASLDTMAAQVRDHFLKPPKAAEPVQTVAGTTSTGQAPEDTEVSRYAAGATVGRGFAEPDDIVQTTLPAEAPLTKKEKALQKKLQNQDLSPKARNTLQTQFVKSRGKSQERTDAKQRMLEVQRKLKVPGITPKERNELTIESIKLRRKIK